jgi:hypothetical protein
MRARYHAWHIAGESDLAALLYATSGRQLTTQGLSKKIWKFVETKKTPVLAFEFKIPERFV